MGLIGPSIINTSPHHAGFFIFREKKMSDEIDVSTFFITDEPYEENRRYYGSKYDSIFAKLKHNQHLAVPEGTAARVGQGLRKWLEKMGHKRPTAIHALGQYPALVSLSVKPVKE